MAHIIFMVVRKEPSGVRIATLEIARANNWLDAATIEAGISETDRYKKACNYMRDLYGIDITFEVIVKN